MKNLTGEPIPVCDEAIAEELEAAGIPYSCNTFPMGSEVGTHIVCVYAFKPQGGGDLVLALFRMCTVWGFISSTALPDDLLETAVRDGRGAIVIPEHEEKNPESNLRVGCYYVKKQEGLKILFDAFRHAFGEEIDP